MPTQASQGRRGRPPKFGRPARLITVTLPDDVIEALKAVHPDPAWAIVRLCERARPRPAKPIAHAELVQLPNRRALIMVNVEALGRLPGVAGILLSDGRGFRRSSRAGRRRSELAVIDRLDSLGVPRAERAALQALRDRCASGAAGHPLRDADVIVAHRPRAPRGRTDERRRGGRSRR